MQGQARCIFSWSKRGLLIPALLEIPAISVLGNQGERSIKLHLARGLIFETGKFTCLLLASQKLLWRQLVIIKKIKACSTSCRLDVAEICDQRCKYLPRSSRNQALFVLWRPTPSSIISSEIRSAYGSSEGIAADRSFRAPPSSFRDVPPASFVSASLDCQFAPPPGCGLSRRLWLKGCQGNMTEIPAPSRQQRLHVLTAIDSAVKKGWFIRTAHSL